MRSQQQPSQIQNIPDKPKTICILCINKLGSRTLKWQGNFRNSIDTWITKWKRHLYNLNYLMIYFRESFSLALSLYIDRQEHPPRTVIFDSMQQQHGFKCWSMDFYFIDWYVFNIFYMNLSFFFPKKGLIFLLFPERDDMTDSFINILLPFCCRWQVFSLSDNNGVFK